MPTKGLHNRGQDCFVNATLQCLAVCRDLRNHFLSSAAGDGDGASVSGGALAAQLGAAINYLCGDGDAGYCATTVGVGVRAAVAEYAEHFGGDGPGDASEFMAVLLAELHDQLNAAAARQDFAPNTGPSNGAEAWRQYVRANDSIVSHLFCGLVQTDNCCLDCSELTREFSELFTLNVSPQETAASRVPLLDCVGAALGGASIAAQMYCCSCCDLRDGRVEKMLVRMPRVLVIHIDWQFGEGDIQIDCPATLDLSAQCRPSPAATSEEGQQPPPPPPQQQQSQRLRPQGNDVSVRLPPGELGRTLTLTQDSRVAAGRLLIRPVCVHHAARGGA